jgi:lipoprotein-anchoring transpeptidase ErfK/SrfK
MQRTTAFIPFLIAVAVSTAGISSVIAQTPPTTPQSKPTAPSPTKPAPTQQPAKPTNQPGAQATTQVPAGTGAAATTGQAGSLDARTQRILALQVALDRAGFSSGEIDAQAGSNTDRALRAFQEAQKLRVTTSKGELDAQTVERLGPAYANPLASYAISADDVAGPFVDKMPEDMMDKSKLPSLAYTSVHELLGEKFHINPKLLQRINPDAKFARGEVIFVPNVEPFLAPGPKATQPTDAKGAANDAARSGNGTSSASSSAAASKQAATNSTTAKPTDAQRGNAPAAAPGASAATRNNAGPVTITVTDKTKTLQVTNAAGETIFHAPVTTGSANDPLPIGQWKVNGVSRNPPFNYNPKLFWDADPTHAKAKIPPGPNNPVGVVWIDLSKEHYGIHGTPEPSRIGHTESHGCIRLTNWDAVRLAALVTPGTKVVLQ